MLLVLPVTLSRRPSLCSLLCASPGLRLRCFLFVHVFVHSRCTLSLTFHLFSSLCFSGPPSQCCSRRFPLRTSSCFPRSSSTPHYLSALLCASSGALPSVVLGAFPCALLRTSPGALLRHILLAHFLVLPRAPFSGASYLRCAGRLFSAPFPSFFSPISGTSCKSNKFCRNLSSPPPSSFPAAANFPAPDTPDALRGRNS